MTTHYSDDYEMMREIARREGVSVLVRVDENDWEGDSLLLFGRQNAFGEVTGRVGFLIYGWGSCEGCDAFLAAVQEGTVEELIKELQDQIQWFDSADKALQYLINKDWSLSYLGRGLRDLVDQFLNRAQGILQP